ncbi:MAG: hypothetical protein ACRCWM_07430 [Sarcina sp.]
MASNVFDDSNDPNSLKNIIMELETEVESLKSNLASKEQNDELTAEIVKLEVMMGGLQRINSSLAYLTINENYKNFYDWRVKPAIDIIALLSSSAANLAGVANDLSNNVYAKKHEVKRALKMTSKMLDEVDKGLELFDVEIECLLNSNKVQSPCRK